MARLSPSTESNLITPGAFAPNHAGRTRSFRLFIVFTGAITALYLVFISLTYAASSPGVRNDVFGIATLSAVWAAFIVVNWFLTIGRAPRGVRRDAETLIVRDSYGRVVRFPNATNSELTVLQRYPAGWLAAEPTELVRVVSPGGRSATYLVGRDLLKA